ncbi:hypothetical protein HAX54_009889, partial [Datura stramonium]|nr:hypothetical protein [Datura stramonium]
EPRLKIVRVLEQESPNDSALVSSQRRRYNRNSTNAIRCKQCYKYETWLSLRYGSLASFD